MSMRANAIPLMVDTPGGYVRSHFKLYEFANVEGLAIVHPCLLKGLEKLRADLSAEYEADVHIIVTCGTRTEEDNAALAEQLGWVEDGGLVARESKHLPKYGGSAADIKAVIPNWDGHGRFTVPQGEVGRLAKRHFLFVKDDYSDGHVHVDQWDRENGCVGCK